MGSLNSALGGVSDRLWHVSAWSRITRDDTTPLGQNSTCFLYLRCYVTSQALSYRAPLCYMRHRLGLRRHSTDCYTHGTDPPRHRWGQAGQRGQRQSCHCCSLHTAADGHPTRQELGLDFTATALQELGVPKTADALVPGVMGQRFLGARSPWVNAWVLTHPVPVFRHLVLGQGWSLGSHSGHITQAQSLNSATGTLGHAADDEEQAGRWAAGAGAAASGHGGQRLPLLLGEAEPFH